MPQFSEESIHVIDLEVFCTIGVRPDERSRKQPLIVNVSYRQDFAAAAETDRIAQTVDYAQISEAIRRYVEASRFQLLESLVRGLALHLVETYSLPHLNLHIRKPRAIADSGGAAVS